MNKVELLATVAANPALQGETPMHVTFPATVTHKTRNGDIRNEDYPVSAWNGTAQWVMDNLSHGQQAMIYGYLTQKRDRSIEICARQIFIIQNGPQYPAYLAKNDTTGAPDENDNHPEATYERVANVDPVVEAAHECVANVDPTVETAHGRVANVDPTVEAADAATGKAELAEIIDAKPAMILPAAAGNPEGTDSAALPVDGSNDLPLGVGIVENPSEGDAPAPLSEVG